MAKRLNGAAAMTARKIPTLSSILLLVALAAPAADWQNVAPGVDYQEFKAGDHDIYVTRVDLTNPQIRVVVSRENEKGLKVSEYAKKNKAVAAINGDYYDDKFTPVGSTVGACGPWITPKDMKREDLIEIASQQASVYKRAELPDPPPIDNVDVAISGWPAIVTACKAAAPGELPGSDSFTRSPHPRTAIGISGDQHTLYFVVADGRRTGVPGLTLADLATFMTDTLKVCSAVNLDGGGSSAMWVGDHIVNRPSDGVERPVGDHLAVVLKKDFNGCDDSASERHSSIAISAKEPR